MSDPTTGSMTTPPRAEAPAMAAGVAPADAGLPETQQEKPRGLLGDAALVAAHATLRDRESVDALADDVRIAEAVLRVRSTNAAVVAKQATTQRPMHARGVRRPHRLVAVVEQVTEDEHAVAEVRLVVAEVRAETLAEGAHPRTRVDLHETNGTRVGLRGGLELPVLDEHHAEDERRRDAPPVGFADGKRRE